MLNVLVLGDIISRVGRNSLKSKLSGLKKRLNVDICTANVENSAGMFGISEKVIDEISKSGVDVMTSGNHVWDKRAGIELLDLREDILRPANYPPGNPGHGYLITESRGVRIAVINLQGRTFMPTIDCPFRSADTILSEIPKDVRVRIVDFHAEATSEKVAMGYYLDGRVSVVAGTHTHVATADERILSGGTAFITDVGMVGASDSIIGVKKEQVIKRFLYALPVRFEVAYGNPRIEGLFVEIDDETGRASKVERIREETGDFVADER